MDATDYRAQLRQLTLDVERLRSEQDAADLRITKLEATIWTLVDLLAGADLVNEGTFSHMLKAAVDGVDRAARSGPHRAVKVFPVSKSGTHQAPLPSITGRARAVSGARRPSSGRHSAPPSTGHTPAIGSRVNPGFAAADSPYSTGHTPFVGPPPTGALPAVGDRPMSTCINCNARVPSGSTNFTEHGEVCDRCYREELSGD